MGYSGHNIPWSGAFVDCVARDAGVFMPACTYTPSGLAEFTLCRRVVETPRSGDVIFYNFSTVQTDPFAMPHVGIVVDADDWKSTGRLITVEGGVDSAVVRTRRTRDDVLAFARPVFKFRPAIGKKKVQTGDIFVIPERVRPGLANADVMNVQIALKRALPELDLRADGLFGDSTLRAIMRWQRVTGHVGKDVTGFPSRQSLRLLGELTGAFSVDA